MKLTMEEMNELNLIKNVTGYRYYIAALPEPLTVGWETHTIAVYQKVGTISRPIITATDKKELASRMKAALANMTFRFGEIMPYLLNKAVGGNEFYVTYCLEIGEDNPKVWYNLYRGGKTISTMLDRETLSTLTHALERVLA